MSGLTVVAAPVRLWLAVALLASGGATGLAISSSPAYAHGGEPIPATRALDLGCWPESV
jgi:hypothetical protein